MFVTDRCRSGEYIFTWPRAACHRPWNDCGMKCLKPDWSGNRSDRAEYKKERPRTALWHRTPSEFAWLNIGGRLPVLASDIVGRVAARARGTFADAENLSSLRGPLDARVCCLSRLI